MILATKFQSKIISWPNGSRKCFMGKNQSSSQFKGGISITILPYESLQFDVYINLTQFADAYNTIDINSMIIPQFKLKQNEISIELFIRVPYIKVSSCEFYIESNTFKFYLKPYLLSLSFEQKLKQTEQPLKAVYYHEKYILQVHLEKQTKGEYFNNLDLISNVVNKKKEKKKNAKVLVEVVNSQGVVEQSQQKLDINEYNYGFEMNYSNVFDNLQQEAIQLFAFNPKNTPLNERYNLSKDLINSQFDIDSYLFDKYENEEQISCLTKDQTFAKYIQQLLQIQKGVQINSEQFKLKMKTASKQILISDQVSIKKQLVSLLFSYLYELICMSGQFGPQSAKTISKTSLVLYCNSFYQGESVEEMITDCFRRCITYSLYKSLVLCQYVKKMITKYLSSAYIKVMLEDMRKLFEKNQPRYLLNRIYIDDYLIYIYSIKQEDTFKNLADEIDKCLITQKDMKLGIEEYQNQDEESEQKQEQLLKKQERKLIEQIQKLQTLD